MDVAIRVFFIVCGTMSLLGTASKECSVYGARCLYLNVYRDIQDLQKQNQQLRSALRELSEVQDRVENGEQNSRLAAKLEQDLSNTRQEVEHLKQSRLKQEDLVQSIIRQRDMYKEMVAQGAMKEVCTYSIVLYSILELCYFVKYWNYNA